MANEFLVFNEANNNALSQADYQSNVVRTGGIAPGLATKEIYNKLFRQVTVMTNAIGEVLVSAGLNASDANSPALIAAITTALSTANKVLVPVVDLASLKAIVTSAMSDSVLIECKALGLFRFDGGSTLAADDVVVVQPTTGIGRWIRIATTMNKEVQTTPLTLYVRTDGNDSNNGLTNTAGGAFKTIQAAINSLPKRLDANATVNVAAGTYDEDVVVSGFIGMGTLTINGDTAASTSRSVRRIRILFNSTYVYAGGFNITSTTTLGINVFASTHVYLRYMNMIAVASQVGLYVESSYVVVSDSVVSNKAYAISSAGGSYVWASYCTGSGNTIGLYSEAATITVYGSEPSGATQRSVAVGGDIRDNNTPMIRNNAGIFEFYNGGTWTPVGLICTKARTVEFSQSSPLINTWYTALSATGKGRINAIAVSHGTSGEFPKIEITIDGVLQVTDIAIGTVAGRIEANEFINEVCGPLEFLTSCQVRVATTVSNQAQPLKCKISYAMA